MQFVSSHIFIMYMIFHQFWFCSRTLRKCSSYVCYSFRNS